RAPPSLHSFPTRRSSDLFPHQCRRVCERDERVCACRQYFEWRGNWESTRSARDLAFVKLADFWQCVVRRPSPNRDQCSACGEIKDRKSTRLNSSHRTISY